MPTSGSRWEPATGAPPTGEETQPASTRRRSGRTALAAAGVGLVLAGGIGGFAIGHAVAGNAGSTGTVSDRSGVPGDGDGRPDVGGDRDPDGFRSGGGAPDGGAADGEGQESAPPISGGAG